MPPVHRCVMHRGLSRGRRKQHASGPARGTKEKSDDEDFPAYTTGRAAEMVEVTQPFLRSLEEEGLIDPQRSARGHRRYSRSHLPSAARARTLVDQGTPITAACRIITLEDQLVEHTGHIAPDDE